MKYFKLQFQLKFWPLQALGNTEFRGAELSTPTQLWPQPFQLSSSVNANQNVLEPCWWLQAQPQQIRTWTPGFHITFQPLGSTWPWQHNGLLATACTLHFLYYPQWVTAEKTVISFALMKGFSGWIAGIQCISGILLLWINAHGATNAVLLTSGIFFDGALHVTCLH